jgi:hypothetical protein
VEHAAHHQLRARRVLRDDARDERSVPDGKGPGSTIPVSSTPTVTFWPSAPTAGISISSSALTAMGGESPP